MKSKRTKLIVDHLWCATCATHKHVHMGTEKEDTAGWAQDAEGDDICPECLAEGANTARKVL